jgi:hypothetical protein
VTSPDSSGHHSPSRETLPLPDYDHLPLNSVIQRVRSLSAEELLTVLAYEDAHGQRLPITEALRTRLSELTQGTAPTGGAPTGMRPEAAGPAPNHRSVDQTTESPSINPPSHGDPTNPSQPR